MRREDLPEPDAARNHPSAIAARASSSSDVPAGDPADLGPFDRLSALADLNAEMQRELLAGRLPRFAGFDVVGKQSQR